MDQWPEILNGKTAQCMLGYTHTHNIYILSNELLKAQPWRKCLGIVVTSICSMQKAGVVWIYVFFYGRSSLLFQYAISACHGGSESKATVVTKSYCSSAIHIGSVWSYCRFPGSYCWTSQAGNVENVLQQLVPEMRPTVVIYLVPCLYSGYPFTNQPLKTINCFRG